MLAPQTDEVVNVAAAAAYFLLLQLDLVMTHSQHRLKNFITKKKGKNIYKQFIKKEN